MKQNKSNDTKLQTVFIGVWCDVVWLRHGAKLKTKGIESGFYSASNKKERELENKIENKYYTYNTVYTPHHTIPVLINSSHTTSTPH
jgi:hypothetical protein